MAEAYIIDAVRTPVGRKNGGLSQVHPADLGAFAIKELDDFKLNPTKRYSRSMCRRTG